MMATCGIWKISSNLGKVIEYTTNEEKTCYNGAYFADKKF